MFHKYSEKLQFPRLNSSCGNFQFNTVFLHRSIKFKFLRKKLEVVQTQRNYFRLRNWQDLCNKELQEEKVMDIWTGSMSPKAQLRAKCRECSVWSLPFCKLWLCLNLLARWCTFETSVTSGWLPDVQPRLTGDELDTMSAAGKIFLNGLGLTN